MPAKHAPTSHHPSYGTSSRPVTAPAATPAAADPPSGATTTTPFPLTRAGARANAISPRSADATTPPSRRRAGTSISLSQVPSSGLSPADACTPLPHARTPRDHARGIPGAFGVPAKGSDDRRGGGHLRYLRRLLAELFHLSYFILVTGLILTPTSSGLLKTGGYVLLAAAARGVYLFFNSLSLAIGGNALPIGRPTPKG